MRSLLLLVLLAGCPLKGQTGSTMAVGSPTTSEASPTSSKSSPTERSAAQEAANHHHYFTRENFVSLKGLPVAQAQTKAKSYGHTGEIQIHEMDEFVAGCKEGTVCAATGPGGGDQSGMSLGDTLMLHTNKKLSIAPPPD